MSRNYVFVPEAWEQYLYWQGQDKKTLKRINILIEAASREPFQGLGKPEPLKGNLSGYWSSGKGIYVPASKTLKQRTPSTPSSRLGFPKRGNQTRRPIANGGRTL